MKKAYLFIVVFLMMYANHMHAQDISAWLSKQTSADEKYNQGNYPEAVRLGTEAVDLCKKALGTEHPDYATSVTCLSLYYSSIGNYSEAIRLGTEAMEIRKKVLGTEHPDYAISLNNLMAYNYNLGNYSEALRFGTEAAEIYKKALGTEHPEYAASLGNLAVLNSQLGNYSEAVRLGTEAMEIRKKTLGTEHPEYATSLSGLASYYSQLGNYSEAIRLGTEAAEILKKALGTEHPNYATSLSDLSKYYSGLGNYSEAVRLGTEAAEIYKKTLGTEHPYYATSLINLSEYYSNLGNYSEAVRLGTEAAEIYKKAMGTEHPQYAISLNNLSGYYSQIGNYSEAVRLATEAAEIYKKALGTEHREYATSLVSLAECNSQLGNYSEAVRLGTEAAEILKKALGTEHPDYAASLNSLTCYYFSLGNYSEAIRLGTEAAEIRKKALGAEHPYYATSLGNLANCYSQLYNDSEALRLGTEAAEIFKKALGAEHPDYAMNLVNLASYNSGLGNNSEALRLATEAAEIYKKAMGTEHPDYALASNRQALYNFKLGNYASAYTCLEPSIESSYQYLINSFSELTPEQQESLWLGGNYADKFNSFLPSAVFKFQNGGSLSELYDKSALFAKGILLNTGIAMRRLILESGDPALIAKYDALSANKSVYDKQLEKPVKERFLNMDSLRSVIRQQEMELARESKAYGDYSRNLRISWKDVQQQLEDDDIAVEFMDFPVYGTDSTMYVALTLRKGYEHPRMTALFEKGQLDAIPSDTYYIRNQMYELVWKPLEQELMGVRDVYFSPSGELHRIGIEYLPVTAKEDFCDKYNLHRLSSTRQLAFIQDETKGDKTILYGGLRYEEKQTATTPDMTQVREHRSPVSHINVDSLRLRGSYEYLPGTKEEVEQIVSCLKRHKENCVAYYEADGTEDSFKHLSGSRPKTLHIATHGFYMTQQDEEHKLTERSISISSGKHEYIEDKPMTRSGLLLAGCMPALNHQTIKEGEEDGILTAAEISRLDMRGLDMVVMSACESGLGDITSGEGVFGLQRGFKNAGAKTIVMSLWKVNDIATQQLMASFYECLLDGQPKEQAFRMAQEELRKQSTFRKKKPDWAAFIMLDGITK